MLSMQVLTICDQYFADTVLRSPENSSAVFTCCVGCMQHLYLEVWFFLYKAKGASGIVSP